MSSAQQRPLFERAIVQRAALDAFGKLDPRRMLRNPVMFVVELGSLFTTLLSGHALFSGFAQMAARRPSLHL